jgi:ATP-dependent helicase/nuclease subunit B
MTIYFGLRLDDSVYPTVIDFQNQNVALGYQYCGRQNLINLLEIHLGLVGHPNNNTHIRIEQYRQALKNYLLTDENAFYKISYEADELATSKTLLDRRDELVLANWNFEMAENMPVRLRVLAEIEANLVTKVDEPLRLNLGFADRFQLVLAALDNEKTPINQIFLNEPMALLPEYLKNLFGKLEKQGVLISELELNTAFDDTDLGQIKKALFHKKNGKRTKINAKADGSLVIINAKRETEAAEFLAKFFRDNQDFKPLCLIPEKNRMLDNALIHEGLPSMGIQSASLARPVLQLLKLVPTFFWRPIDPFKIMEFVSLAVKPLRDDLANLIASEMAQTPGLRSDRWKIMIDSYFEDLQKRATLDKNINVKAVKEEYDFWFKRQRYDISSVVPKAEVLEVFHRVSNWASKEFEHLGSKQPSLLVLSEQAKRICELLEAYPETETHLTHLELERIVKTIYEPSPVTFKKREINHLPFVHHSSSVIQSVENLVWWNFSQNEVEHFFARWYSKEEIFLKAKNVTLSTPKEENTLLLWQRPRAILQCQKTLFLIVSQMIDGTEFQPHPLYSDLEATFANLQRLTVEISSLSNINILNHFKISEKINIQTKNLGQPMPYLTVTKGQNITQREAETFTSLEALFYYPYQWVFKYKLGLQKTSILSVVKDSTLMGNLSHRLFEVLFKQPDVLTWDRAKVQSWVTKNINRLLEKEGAVLLMYGREPEKTAFVNTLQYSAWSLINMIKNNGWQIQETEKNIEGTFNGMLVKAKADLVLKNNKGEFTILDLKWRGATFRQNMIKSEEDLQLVMYAMLLTKDESVAQTAFYIIQDAKMIARNNSTFKEAIAALPDKDYFETNNLIWRRMVKTYQWRLSQLKEGKIEVRTKMTYKNLEEPGTNENDGYADFDNYLEMKNDDAPFDDYKTLINLID